jgi:hypothetical protein
MRDASRIIVLPDGRSVWLNGLVTDQLGPWVWLDAMPFAFIGGPVVNEGLLSRHDFAHIIQQIKPGTGWLSINLDPLSRLATPDMLGAGASVLTTHLLRLEGDFEAAQRQFSKTARYDARTAEKKGVSARRGSDFNRYLELTRLAAWKWGLTTPPFPEPLYGALAALPDDQVCLWLADYEDQSIAGLISLHYAPGRALYWASAMHPDYVHLNPTKLLLREAIRAAAERGVTVFNMGPSVGFDGQPLDGVRQLKEAFGAKPHEYAVYLAYQPWALRLRAVRERLSRLRYNQG